MIIGQSADDHGALHYPR